MPLPDNVPPDVAFSLTCEGCDAGMEIDTYDQAQAQGWIGIDYDPDGLAWNFLGLCPDCRREEEERDRKRGLSHT